MSLAIERDSSPPDPAAVYLFIELELDPDRSLSPSVDADGSLHVGVTELQPGSTDDASTGRGDRDGRAERASCSSVSVRSGPWAAASRNSRSSRLTSPRAG